MASPHGAGTISVIMLTTSRPKDLFLSLLSPLGLNILIGKGCTVFTSVAWFPAQARHLEGPQHLDAAELHLCSQKCTLPRPCIAARRSLYIYRCWKCISEHLIQYISKVSLHRFKRNEVIPGLPLGGISVVGVPSGPAAYSPLQGTQGLQGSNSVVLELKGAGWGECRARPPLLISSFSCSNNQCTP